jgi:hypothetical protein
MENKQGPLRAYASSLGRWGWGVLTLMLADWFGVATSFYGVDYNKVPLWTWVALGYLLLLIAPFLAFRALYLRHLELEGQLAKLTDESIKIDPDPIFDPKTNYWRISVENTSKRTLNVTAQLSSFLSNSTYDIPLPLPLQATHQPSADRVAIGAGSRQLFDLCQIETPDPSRLIASTVTFMGVRAQPQMSANWENLVVDAFTDGRARDSCRFVLSLHQRDFWEIIASH